MKMSLLKEMSARYAKFLLAMCLLLCVGSLSAQEYEEPEGTSYKDPVSGLCFKLYANAMPQIGSEKYWAELVAPERDSEDAEHYQKMTKLDVPSTVTSDGVTYPVTGIGSYLGVGSLEIVKIPGSVNKIGYGAFYNSAKLDSVVFEPKADGTYSLQSIESGAFQGCGNLGYINLPPSVESLGGSCFQECSFISFEIPENVKSVGKDCFYHCSALSSVEWNSSADIPDECFEKCGKLHQVVISEGVEKLGRYCFVETNLNFLVLPKSVTSIGGKICNSSVSLISLNPEPPFLDQDVLYGQTGNIYVPEGSVDAYKAAYGWKTYADNINVVNYGPVTAKNGLLYDIDLYSGVATLLKNTDANGNSLYTDSYYAVNESVAANGGLYGVKSMADGAFENCKNLVDLDLPANLLSYGKNVFKGCDNLKSIIIGKSDADKIPAVKFDDHLYANCHVYVPETLLTIYQKTRGWNMFGANLEGTKEFLQTEDGLLFKFENGEKAHALVSGFDADKAKDASHVVIPTSVDCYNRTYAVTELGDGCFSNCASLQEVEIPESITKVGFACFDACLNLTNVVMPANLKAVPSFTRCTSLKSIVLPANAETIDCRFDDCTALEEVTFPTNLKALPYGIFRNCSSLKHIDLPESLEKIEDFAFEGCTALTEVHIPENVTSLGENVFYGCTSLVSVYLPLNLQKMGRYCLRGCPSLKNLYNPNPEPIALEDEILGDYGDYKSCILWVPEGMGRRYSYAKIWENFTIREIDYTGVDAVEADADKAANAPVYDLNGVCVSKNGTEGLAKGIYIVNGKKVIK